jgi:hypothetical protein
MEDKRLIVFKKVANGELTAEQGVEELFGKHNSQDTVKLSVNSDITYKVIGWVTLENSHQVIVSNQDGHEYRYECEIERVKANNPVKGFKK